MLTEFALAKVNLFLHVLGRRPDGYHLLESLVAFAEHGDEVHLLPDQPLGLSIEGPFAAGLSVADHNLVLRAARSFVAHVGPGRLGRFLLVKALPVASGIGGGSADAAAALRLLARANDIPLSDPRLIDCAAMLGADVPACLDRKTRLISGIGHELGPPLASEPAPVLLVNPGVGVSTAEIFRQLGLEPGQRHERAPVSYARMPLQPLNFLATQTRNDLQPPAEALVPEITAVLGALRQQAGCWLARMSGSGATCYAIFSNAHARNAAARDIAARNPGWWVSATALRLPGWDIVTRAPVGG